MHYYIMMRRLRWLTRFYMKLRGLDIKMVSTSCPNLSDHITVTQSSSRNEVISPATIVELNDLSSTVKMLSLEIKDERFSFKAGQWVDTFIPGMETVGGFSMCSSPAMLKTQGLLQLAVKKADHPPAYWVHYKCKLGDIVHLRVGGDFYFDPHPQEKNPSDVLLIAGGVGINPLYSMVQHVNDMNGSLGGPYRGKVLMLYSAKTCSDFIFKDHLETLSDKNPNIIIKFFSSRDSKVPASVKLKAGRIGFHDIQKSVQELRAESLKIYMCGPSPMVHDIENYCRACGIDQQQIFYERWW